MTVPSDVAKEALDAGAGMIGAVAEVRKRFGLGLADSVAVVRSLRPAPDPFAPAPTPTAGTRGAELVERLEELAEEWATCSPMVSLTLRRAREDVQWSLALEES